MKSQLIRLVDILVIGPFMIYASKETKSPVIKTGLIIFGIATIVYNAQNFIIIQKTHK